MKAYWKKHYVMTYNVVTGKKDYPLHNGYRCSNCLKVSYAPFETCSGCGADMTISTINIKD